MVINLFKGKYRPSRIIQTIVNFGVLITMLCLGFSGIVMSRHVFAAFSIHGPMATARMMHLAASYWGFVLMSVHLGLHWSMILGMCRKLTGSREKPQAVFREYIAMMGFWDFAACYISKGIIRIPASKNSAQKNEEKEGGSR